jgi:hypothetical protein
MPIDENRRRVLDAIRRGEFLAGGPSELAARDLLNETPSDYLERWASAAAERIRPHTARCCCHDGGQPDSAGRCQRCWGHVEATR